MEPLREDDPRSLGGFRVLALLAVGGMGRVYLALGPDRRAVALKVARAEFAADARFRARFRREVETGRGVGSARADGGAGFGDGLGRHGRGGGGSGGGSGSSGGTAWIAPVVAADPDAELPWLASEYVPGPSVTEALMGFGPLSARGLRTLARGLALALAEVHAAGVVHRDVKPSNVLLARDGPRLIDFGVARAIDDVQLTRVGAVIGSPGFLSPEQAVGKSASFGSDVFSLAAVVAYAACGVGPFGAGAGPALLYRVVHEPPKLVNVPRELAEVLAACLVKDPGERPTAAEVAAHLPERGAAGWLSEPVLGDIARREAELAAWIEVAGGLDDSGAASGAERREAVAAAEFEAVADTALELANAGLSAGFEFEIAADSALRLANAGPRADLAGPRVDLAAPQADLAAPPAPPAPVLTGPPPDEPLFGDPVFDDPVFDDPVLDDPVFDDPVRGDPSPARPRTSHRRAARRRRHRIPVYAAFGAVLGAAAATVVLLLPRGAHDAPPPSHGPATTSRTSPTPTTAPTLPTLPTPTQRTAPPAASGRRSGPTERTGTPGRSAKATSASGSPR